MTLDFKRIVVPLDFSANSQLALNYAHAVALRFDAALHLVHVCEVPAMATGSMDAYAIAYTGWSRQLGDEAERQLVDAQKKLSAVPVTTEVLFGNPARCIVAAASAERADLIVMGTHGHGPIMHVLMGNVAERVVRSAPCPVLTVREPAVGEKAEKATSSGAATVCAIGAFVFAMLLSLPALAQETPLKQVVTGGELFRT